MGRHTVAQQGCDQPREVAEWQRHKADAGAEAAEGQVNAEGHDDAGQNDNGSTCPALNERDFLGTNHMHDQRL